MSPNYEKDITFYLTRPRLLSSSKKEGGAGRVCGLRQSKCTFRCVDLHFRLSVVHTARDKGKNENFCTRPRDSID